MKAKLLTRNLALKRMHVRIDRCVADFRCHKLINFKVSRLIARWYAEP